ncbi:MAG TPA: hypothetical protein IAB96_07270 [Candidatus Coprenecus pullicola]|nr:hypothetical protein [Candidatus Coprenecus pullicola]
MKHSYAYILLLGLAVLLPSLTSCGQKPVTDGGLISVQYEKLPQGEDLLPAIVLDRRTGKVSRRTVIDDILTMDETSPSFKCGYLAESYSPEYFIEISAKALEEGNLSNAARKRISTILENLSEEDNNVILLAPIK